MIGGEREKEKSNEFNLKWQKSTQARACVCLRVRVYVCMHLRHSSCNARKEKKKSDEIRGGF